MSIIGIYGGTFDPIHFGHLRTALEVKEVFSLDEIRFIPCAQPAHKTALITAAEQRLDMLKLAIQNQQGMTIDRRELDRPGVSYMIDTLKSIRNEIANAPLLLFIGMDAFKSITTWHQWRHLFDYAHIVVMNRPPYNQSQQHSLSEFLNEKLTKNSENLAKKHAGCLFFQPVIQLDISATHIRNLLAKGFNPSYLLPDNVIHYIKENKLYI